MRRFGFLLSLLLASPAAAQTLPPPMDPHLFSFPAFSAQPPSAISAGHAMADAWLGDEPFGNPATPPRGLVVVSPALLRMSRQDLRADNRNYDEQTAFFDGAGAAICPGLPFWIYVHQPQLRLEDYAFTRGTGRDPTVIPAVVSGQGELRELRAGAASSLQIGPVRTGLAVEWTRRDDLYRTVELSGAPDQGEREASFDGSGVGGALGLRFDSADSGAGAWTAGLSVRYLPAMEVEGTTRSDLLSGASETPIAAEIEGGIEGGLSVRYMVTEALGLMAAGGYRTEQTWEGFDLTAGPVAMMRLGFEYDDPEDPYAFRLGIGQDQQTDVPEPRTGLLGLGFSWDMEGVTLDTGILHRSIQRPGSPTSYDDRVVLSARVDF